MPSPSEKNSENKHVEVRGGGRRRWLADVCKSYWLASTVVWLAVFIMAAIAMRKEPPKASDWGLIILAPVLAPLGVPVMILVGVDNLARYGNKYGSNFTVALTITFLAVWAVVFYIFRWRGRQLSTPST